MCQAKFHFIYNTKDRYKGLINCTLAPLLRIILIQKADEPIPFPQYNTWGIRMDYKRSCEFIIVDMYTCVRCRPDVWEALRRRGATRNENFTS